DRPVRVGGGVHPANLGTPYGAGLEQTRRLASTLVSTGESTPRGRPEAIVRPRAGAEVFRVERFPPGPELAEFVDYHWLVQWDVPTEHRQQVVPQPRVHVA